MDRIPGVTRRSDGTVRIRPTGRRRLLDAATDLPVPVALVLITRDWWTWLLLGVALAVLLDRARSRAGVTLRGREAVVHELFRSRRIPWSRVQAVTVDEQGGRSVVLWTEDRERIRLAAPSALRASPRFDAVVDLISRHWLTHRGPDWAPAW